MVCLYVSLFMRIRFIEPMLAFPVCWAEQVPAIQNTV